MSKLTSAIALGLGLAVLPATVGHAQLGAIGEAAKKGATDAATKEVMERAGLATPSPSPTASPAEASPTAATSPSPAATPASTSSPASVATASPAAAGVGTMLMDEAAKKMAPKLP